MKGTFEKEMINRREKNRLENKENEMKQNLYGTRDTLKMYSGYAQEHSFPTFASFIEYIRSKSPLGLQPVGLLPIFV